MHLQQISLAWDWVCGWIYLNFSWAVQPQYINIIFYRNTLIFSASWSIIIFIRIAMKLRPQEIRFHFRNLFLFRFGIFVWALFCDVESVNTSNTFLHLDYLTNKLTVENKVLGFFCISFDYKGCFAFGWNRTKYQKITVDFYVLEMNFQFLHVHVSYDF